MSRNNKRKVVPYHGTGAPTDLSVGEIAVSTEEGKEALFVKNDAGNIVKVDFHHHTILTQEQYDALPNKIEGHLYYIK